MKHQTLNNISLGDNLKLMEPLLFISCGPSSPRRSGGAQGAGEGCEERSSVCTNPTPACSLLAILIRERTDSSFPSSRCSPLGSCYYMYAYTTRRFNTGQVFTCMEAGECILETFHFGIKKQATFLPGPSTSPQVHLCIRKAQAHHLRTASWQRPGL